MKLPDYTYYSFETFLLYRFFVVQRGAKSLLPLINQQLKSNHGRQERGGNAGVG